MKLFRWGVTLGERTVMVIAPDKFGATKEAAKKMQVIWSKVARDMIVTKMGEVRKE